MTNKSDNKGEKYENQMTHVMRQVFGYIDEIMGNRQFISSDTTEYQLKIDIRTLIQLVVSRAIDLTLSSKADEIVGRLERKSVKELFPDSQKSPTEDFAMLVQYKEGYNQAIDTAIEIVKAVLNNK